MIIITEIKTIQTDQSAVEEILQSTNRDFLSSVRIGDQIVDVIELRKLIKGRRFIDKRNNIDVVVGVSNEAGKILGLMYDSWENMQVDLESLRTQRDLIQCDLSKIKKYGFLKRLKCLFVGF